MKVLWTRSHEVLVREINPKSKTPTLSRSFSVLKSKNNLSTNQLISLMQLLIDETQNKTFIELKKILSPNSEH